MSWAMLQGGLQLTQALLAAGACAPALLPTHEALRGALADEALRFHLPDAPMQKANCPLSVVLCWGDAPKIQYYL